MFSAVLSRREECREECRSRTIYHSLLGALILLTTPELLYITQFNCMSNINEPSPQNEIEVQTRASTSKDTKARTGSQEETERITFKKQ